MAFQFANGELRLTQLVLNRLFPSVVLGECVVADIARAALQAGKHSGEAVVILLRNFIELVIMAAGTVDSHRGGGSHHLCHHVIQIQRAGAAAQDRALGFHLPDEIPWAGREEAGGHDGIRIVRPHDITGDLFLQKAVVRFVGIEGADDVVAVGPRIRSELVALEAVCVGVVGNVQPVLGKAFAEMRRVQQGIDEFLVCLGIGIVDKRLHVLRCGW